MSELTSEQLLDLAEVFALDALDDDERRDVVAALASAPPAVRRRFESVVAEVRQTLAEHSTVDAVEPPAHVHDALMDQVSPSDGTDEVRSIATRRRRLWLAVAAAAAAVIVAVVGVGVATQFRQPPAPSAADQLLTAADLQSSSAAVPGGGSMTVLYSRKVDAGVVILNGVAAPASATAYQMWQVPDAGRPRSLGVMGAADIGPSTRVPLQHVDGTSSIAVSVEPPGGSSAPTRIVVSVPLRG
ncbi:anti-sigma factor [Gordonia sp. TBRC 11910]|uniref:Regulator of SigK n=1 Tax=Gordonia asplenii TaxID=2725283 RepID=A0A848KTY4_9ACTN|nr:anti-sigma factor [Gordonia asplenii]NMO01960.1 anti-sigma factor [Gordonia asplenii]